MTKMIHNPDNAFGQTDPNAGHPQWVATLAVVGSVAVAFGDAVALLYNTTTLKLQCEPFDTDAAGQNARVGVGVALEAGSAGEFVNVVILGFALVNVGAATPARGTSLIGTTTKGVLAAAAAEDATLIVGTVIGQALGAKDANNRAPVWVANK